MNDDRTVQDLEKLFGKTKGARTQLEAVWFLNLAYYLGWQWVFWNRGRLDRPKLDPWRITLVDNRIIGIVRQELARMVKQRPAWQAVPTTGDQPDLDAALISEKIMDHKWQTMNLQEKLERALLWSRVTGAGFWKVIWDSTKGEQVTIVLDPEGKPAMHPETGAPTRPQDYPGGQLPEGHAPKMIATGDVDIAVRSAFEVFPDPIAQSLSEAEFLFEVSVHSAEYVKQRYGVDVEPDTDIAGGPAEGRLFPSFQMGGTSGYQGVKIHEYWCKPNSRHPEGRRAVWAKGKMLFEGPNTYGTLPYVMFSAIPVPGRFWPTSIVEQLRGPQTELNKIKSQIAENANRIGNPALLASRQANVQYSGVPGERVDFDDTVPNAIPSYLQAPEMPAYVLQQQDRIENSLQEISGQHEVSSGMVPAGVTAASAIQLIQEADDTRLGPAIADMEGTLSKAGQMLMKLIGQYYTDDRVVLIAGEDHAWDVLNFKGAMLRGNTHVQVQTGSMFPRSKAQRQAAIQDALNLRMQYSQIPVDPKLMRKVLRDYEQGALEKLWGDVEDDTNQVNRENQKLSKGIPLDINSYDDDQQHIDGHVELQKSAAYEQLDPQVRQLVELHVAAHRERLLQAQAPQMPIPGMENGAGGGMPPMSPTPGPQTPRIAGG